VNYKTYNYYNSSKTLCNVLFTEFDENQEQQLSKLTQVLMRTITAPNATK
jgi:hypothetical protein